MSTEKAPLDPSLAPSGAGTLVKHALDLVAAAFILAVCSPLILVLALLIRVTMGSPVFFRQIRPGLLERPFTLIKFRTMRPARVGDSDPWFRSDSVRLTRLGRVLRKLSLDELPQLFNVLRGDMSLVGPRPLLMEYLPKYTEEQRQRHLVRPGITGLAAVYGRQNLTFSRRFVLDVEYVRNWSLLLDLRILLRTVANVFTGRDVDLEQSIDDVDDLGLAPDSSDRKVPDDE